MEDNQMKNLTLHPAVFAVIVATVVGCSSATTQPETPHPAAGSAPATLPAPATAQVARAATGAEKRILTTTRYTVVPGDHLWGISSRAAAYGNAQEWPLIYRANQDRIQDADLIYPGEVLVIQKEPTAAQVAAAVRHARTRGQWKLGAVEASDRTYLAAYAAN
jgi:LysM repeat protein